MSSKKKQLMGDRSEQDEDKMDGEDAEKVRCRGRKRVSQTEKDNMIAFLVQHFREHVGMRGLCKKYAEVQGTGILYETYRCRFRKHLTPNIHEFDCSVKTKLEIYQKFRIKVNEGYIEELKKHADVTLKEGVVLEFKMKDNTEKVEEPGEVNGQMAGSSSRPKRTRDGAAETNSAKKARNGRGFEEEDEEDLIFDRVVPGNAVSHPAGTVVAPKNEQIQEPVQDDGEFYPGQYNDHQEKYIPNFGDNGMEARMMAAMRDMMHGFMGTINKKFAASEEKMAGMSTKIDSLQREMNAIRYEEVVGQINESNKDLVEKMTVKMSEVVTAIRSIGERSGSHGANPGPSEPNQTLTGFLEHHKTQFKTIIDECQTLDPNIKEESLRLLMEMFVTISEK